MTMDEQRDRSSTIFDGITAALAYIDDQIEDLRSIIKDEVEEEALIDV